MPKKGPNPKNVYQKLPNGMTIGQKHFADAILEGKSQSQAIEEAFNVTSRSSANSGGWKMMQNEKVVAYLVENGYGAASRIVKLSKEASNENVRLAANQDILDRAKVGTKESITAVQINFQSDRDEFR